jgi:HSP20 family protein
MRTVTPTEDRSTEQQYVIPPVNIWESQDAIILEAEMPGVDKNGLEVSVNGNELTITGRRRKEEAPTEPVWQEIPTYDFRRVFNLGEHINRADIKASFEAGLLQLRLPKSEEVKPRKIEVQFQ